jgi:2-(1,2-epoxy-1,2-dihydrophenyl)acetyl-CoA isomerase
MTYENLQLSRDGHVAVVTLDRPDKLNAISTGLSRELVAVMDELRADDDVRSIVITGAGRGFCSGADLTSGEWLRDRSEQSQNERLDEMGWVGRQAIAVHRCDKPTIAAINGVAAGAGMSLALACDVRVGGSAARFRTVFAERGLSPDSGMSYFLTRIVGYARACDLVFTSRDIDAAEAYRLGLLDRLIDDADPVGAAVELGHQMSALPPMAIRSAKRVLQHNLEVDLEDALRYEMAGLSYARRAPNDAREAGLSFRERRPATYTGT